MLVAPCCESAALTSDTLILFLPSIQLDVPAAASLGLSFACQTWALSVATHEGTMSVPTPDITKALVPALEQLRNKYLQFQTHVKIADEAARALS